MARRRDVVINDVAHLDDAEALQARVVALGRRAVVTRPTFPTRAAVEAMVANSVQQFGRLDIAVANAYRSIRQPFLNVTEEAMAATFAVTYKGVFHTLQLAARAMVAQDKAGG